MNRKLSILVSTFAVVGLCSSAVLITRQSLAQGPPQEKNEQQEQGESGTWQRPTAPSSKISPVQAIAAATAKLGGGTAFSANFEFDEGHWVYGVMVVKGHNISEVEVDPSTGVAGAAETVDPADEAKEMKDDLTKVQQAGG